MNISLSNTVAPTEYAIAPLLKRHWRGPPTWPHTARLTPPTWPPPMRSVSRGINGFVDGNKRTAWVVARLFLEDNGYRLHFDAGEAIQIMEGTAAGSGAEPELAAWFRARLTHGSPDVS